MIGWTWRRLVWLLRETGSWYNSRTEHTLTVEERVKRIERWIEIHHPLIPKLASPEEVKEREYDWTKDIT